MKSGETLVRLKLYQVDEQRRRVREIQTMLADFGRLVSDLDGEIAAEEQKTGISDPEHFAYPTYARAARQRAANLRDSMKELEGKLEDAQSALEDASQELSALAQQQSVPSR